MGLEQELGIDIGNVDVNAAAAAVAGNGLVPEGLHHAVLDSVKSGTANSGTPFREFNFKILAGPAAGSNVEHTLWLPHDGQDEAKKKKSINQLAIYMHRLGLKKKVPGPGGKELLVNVEGKHDFADVIGEAVCVIDVKHELEEWTDKKTNKPRSMTKAKLSFEGVLSVDDPRCKDVPKGKVPAGSGGAAGAKPTAAKKDQFGDI